MFLLPLLYIMIITSFPLSFSPFSLLNPFLPLNMKVRASLEKAIVEHTPSTGSPYPEYLERVTLETFRRLVRTCIFAHIETYGNLHLLRLLLQPHWHWHHHTATTTKTITATVTAALTLSHSHSHRYPVTGNMTVRSVNRTDFELVGGYPVPQGVPIHMHMWSLHNTARWDKIIINSFMCVPSFINNNNENNEKHVTVWLIYIPCWVYLLSYSFTFYLLDI